jgi:hypothetical protein
MDKIAVKIIEQNECTGGYSNSNIKIELNNITFHYANMLRRVLKTYIPTYAFSKVTIAKNTGILNNDQIRERFMNIPVMYVKNDEKTVLQFLDLYNGKTVDENHLSMYINYKNKTGKLAMVTTDMAKFYLDGIEIKSPYKKPLLLLKLNNDEEFECTCQSQLGVNLEEQYESPAIYDPVAGCAYEQVEENKFILNFETNQQFSEKEALRRALSCLLMRLEFLNNMVKEKVNPDSEKEGILKETDVLIENGKIIKIGKNFCWNFFPSSKPVTNTNPIFIHISRIARNIARFMPTITIILPFLR